MRRDRTARGFASYKGILLFVLLLGGCTALQKESPPKGSLSLPPITSEPTGEVHPGKFVWHDLLTPDTVASQSFYGALFGWSFRNVGDYIEIYNGEHKIGGILAIRPEKQRKVPAQWLAAMSVSDLRQATGFVASGGGQVLNGPMSLGERGHAALISDPAGAHLLLLRAEGGDPEDDRPGIGDWLWNEVWTLQPDELIAFYDTLGQYDEVIRGDDYAILIGEGHWRAGVRTIREKAYAGRWVPVVRVKDPAALLEKVRELGGEVWLEPGEGDAREDTALIADNQGALLILQRWTFTEEEAH